MTARNWAERRRRPSRPKAARARAQAIVEFALVAPLFFLLIFSIIEFGWYVYQVQSINEAAREGARYAVVHGSTSLCPSGPMPGAVTNWCDPTGAKVEAAVSNYAVGIAPRNLTFSTLSWAPNNGRGSIFSVVVQTTYHPLIPLVPLPTITIEGASTLVVQH